MKDITEDMGTVPK